ncbi:C2 domain-containing protein, partial [Phyllosticta citriasiana]
HTNGIYSDMSVDGPEIGTLVVVVDRAKNLPNRKTMGKQDPYCAARLGKEAKKTETDKRGGQTPKWDQELRFTVRESPDYYTMKVSVFNDDKKTELIGETFIRLFDVIVPRGGQSDTWHSLQCKGKYAGEIRLELTYYDTRPPSESTPVVEPKQEYAPVKRRPLPKNPAAPSEQLQLVQPAGQSHAQPPRRQWQPIPRHGPARARRAGQHHHARRPQSRPLGPPAR